MLLVRQRIFPVYNCWKRNQAYRLIADSNKVHINSIKWKILKSILQYLTEHNIVILGNIIEWKYPESVQLSGVEFKALASGSHNVFQDFV